MDRNQQIALVNDLFHSENYGSLSELINHLHNLLHRNLQKSDLIVSDMVDKEFLEEIRQINSQRDILLYFGKTLRHLKCVLPEDSGLREHEIVIQYKGPKKLWVSDAVLPYSALQNKEYSCVNDIITSFEEYIASLSGYFYQLERIDRFCTVVEPIHPTFKDSYRRVLLDDRMWLHVEVTPEGFANNVQLLGKSEKWQDKLQTGLLIWDHDKDIVENITTVFDIMNFPDQPKSPPSLEVTTNSNEHAICGICLCSEYPDMPAIPQPLCQNPQCVVYFHRTCLYEWLVACSGGRPPAFGVATGTCPVCLQPTECREKDS